MGKDVSPHCFQKHIFSLVFCCVALFLLMWCKVTVGNFGRSRAADDDKQQVQKTWRSNLDLNSATDESEITGNRVASEASSRSVSERFVPPISPNMQTSTLTRTSAHFCLLPKLLFIFSLCRSKQQFVRSWVSFPGRRQNCQFGGGCRVKKRIQKKKISSFPAQNRLNI